MVVFAYIIPALVVYLGFVLLPLIDASRLSLYRWDGVSDPTWVGVANYQEALTDSLDRSALMHAGVLVFFYSLLPTGLGLITAASLARVRVFGAVALRAIYFYPQMIASVVMGVSWSWLLDFNGPVNHLLAILGLGALARGWLGDFFWALPAVGIIGTWATFGLCTMLFVSGIQRIPLSLYQAARVDGAGWWQEFRFVTVPSLRTEITIVLVLTIIFALRVFGTVFVTTQGGPGDATMVPSLLIYEQAFQTNQVGSAASLAVIMTVTIAAISLVLTIIRRRGDRSA